MNKICGNQSDFAYIKDEGSRITLGYELVAIEGSELYEWYEVYFYKKKDGIPNFKKVKEAIQKDINDQTDYKILTGFVWNGNPVWLSSENLFNFKAAYDLALQTQGQSLPVTFKLGEQDGEPVYHVFEDMAEFTDFYTKTIAYINQCLQEGWQRKDSIDWDTYKQYFPEDNINNE